jgi:prepilin-type N-terminal cleavage/methylation domain-containing protein
MKKGFTLIELLVVISIIGILIGLSVFGLQGARTASRDAKRKADLEQIRSGLELYKSDCNIYSASVSFGNALKGTDSSGSCLSTNTYISKVPQDALFSTRNYYYTVEASKYCYILCASLEVPPSSPVTSVTCSDGTVLSCGSNCGTSCNYSVTNP